MRRPPSSSSKKANHGNPETTERQRLKKLALGKNLISETLAKCSTFLAPSKLVQKHHGKDLLRKSHRKNRFLFSFPGLLAPISGGKIGELKDLGTKNPILYLDFPQGQMKLFGTIVYPKNRYLTLQFSRGGKNVICEDYFDSMIVFSDAWWIGRKEQNPEEARLDFPKDLCEGQQPEFDFKGGAGVVSSCRKDVTAIESKHVEIQSPEAESGDDLSDDDKILENKIEATPVRHSERNAGKKFKFAEASSESDAETSEEEGKDVVAGPDSSRIDTSRKNSSSCPIILDIEDDDAVETSLFPEQNKVSVTPGTKSIKSSESTVAMTKDNSQNAHGSLVQATISTLFKKVAEKIPRDMEKTSSSKVSAAKLKFKRKNAMVEESKKKAKSTDEKKTARKKKESKAEDEEDSEEFSSMSQNSDGSDEDWSG